MLRLLCGCCWHHGQTWVSVPFQWGGEKPDQTYSPPPFQVALLSCSSLLPCPGRRLAICLHVHCSMPGLSSSVFLNILFWFWLLCCRKASACSLRYSIHLLIDDPSCAMGVCQSILCASEIEGGDLLFLPLLLLFAKSFSMTGKQEQKLGCPQAVWGCNASEWVCQHLWSLQQEDVEFCLGRQGKVGDG